MPRVPGCDAVYDVADDWRERCLKQDESLLWPDLNAPTWVPAVLGPARDVITELVIRKTTTGGHMQQRLRDEPIELRRVIADATAIWNLCPGSIGIEGRTGFVSDIARLADDFPALEPIIPAIQANIGRKESAWFKPGFQIQRGAHLRFIMEITRRLKIEHVDPDNYLDMRNLGHRIRQEYPRSASAENMVLHLLFPEQTEPIFNNWARDRIAASPEFAEFFREASDFDDAIATIRTWYSAQSGRSDFDFYDPELRKIWRPTEEESGEAELDQGEEESVDYSPSSKLVDLVNKAHIPRLQLKEIESLLHAKKQIILEGPPGVGKTFVARLFARYLAGVGLDDGTSDRVEIVQFHQSYGYEDFVAGIRPVTSESGQLTYRSEPGIFLQMCRRAEERPDETFVLIIDEINRGNLSRIFGELLYALEYREQAVRLQTPVEIDGERIEHLRIPDNLYLIGTMNSTDRSLAMIDYALRRRFYFWRLMPTDAEEAPVLRRWLETQSDLTPAKRAHVHGAFTALNAEIGRQLGEDYQIGHSYFMLPDGALADPIALERVWRHAIEPLLREYFHTRSNAGTAIEQLRIGFFGAPVPVAELSEPIELDQ